MIEDLELEFIISKIKYKNTYLYSALVLIWNFILFLERLVLTSIEIGFQYFGIVLALTPIS